MCCSWPGLWEGKNLQPRVQNGDRGGVYRRHLSLSALMTTWGLGLCRPWVPLKSLWTLDWDRLDCGGWLSINQRGHCGAGQADVPQCHNQALNPGHTPAPVSLPEKCTPEANALSIPPYFVDHIKVPEGGLLRFEGRLQLLKPHPVTEQTGAWGPGQWLGLSGVCAGTRGFPAVPSPTRSRNSSRRLEGSGHLCCSQPCQSQAPRVP